MLDPMSLPDEIPVGEAYKYLDQVKSDREITEIPNEIPVGEAYKYRSMLQQKTRSRSQATTGASSGYSGASSGVTTGLGKQIAPTKYPIQGRVSQEYGAKVDYEKSGFHGGVDIAVPEGTPIPDPVGGEVIGVESKSTGYGKSIIVRGEDGKTRRYSHLSSFKVNVGNKIKAGQVIGLSGNTGKSTGGHLDYREYL